MLRRDEGRVAERAPHAPACGARPTALAGTRILPIRLNPIGERKIGMPRAVAAPADPGVRWSRVMTARARIAVGFYDRREIRASLADAVLRELQRP